MKSRVYISIHTVSHKMMPCTFVSSIAGKGHVGDGARGIPTRESVKHVKEKWDRAPTFIQLVLEQKKRKAIFTVYQTESGEGAW